MSNSATVPPRDLGVNFLLRDGTRSGGCATCPAR